MEGEPVGLVDARTPPPRRARRHRAPAGQSAPAVPYCSASAHQVANRSSPSPCAARHALELGGRGVAAKSSSSADRLVSQAVSRSRESSLLSSRAALPIVIDLGADRGRRGGVLVGVLDAEVGGVGEAPRGREVRRGLDGRDRLRGVQRVDQDEVRALLTRPARKRRRGRPGRRRPTTPPSAPGRAASSRPTRGRARARPAAGAAAATRSGSRSSRLTAVEVGMQEVPARRQVAGQLDRRATGQDARRPRAGRPSCRRRGRVGGRRPPARRAPRRCSRGGRAPTPRASSPPASRPSAAAPGASRAGLPPRGRRGRPPACRRRRPEPAEHGHERLRRDRHLTTLPVPVLRRDPVLGREVEQRLVGGGGHVRQCPTQLATSGRSTDPVAPLAAGSTVARWWSARSRSQCATRRRCPD